MRAIPPAEYNERLFAPRSLRGWYHLRRFRWLADSLRALRMSPDSILEMGCFDAKTIEHLPRIPSRYLGFDAGWEGGLDAARKMWSGNIDFEFRLCRTASDLQAGGETFDAVICMDTLEHVPPGDMETYLDFLTETTRGRLFITVPNEKGVVFALKYLLKAALGGNDPYSFGEFWNTALGRLSRIQRREHKGFDYEIVIASIKNRFASVTATGIPFPRLPLYLNLSVGIIGDGPRTSRR